MVYDRTCRGRGVLPGLTHSWIAGGLLYRGLGRLDAHFGASSWAEAFDLILRESLDRPIGEIQFWGHGRWGCALIQGDRFDEGALSPGHPLHDPLSRIRDRMERRADRDPLFWFRTCETFGKPVGHSFARALTSFLQARAAGHTYIIGPWQSGLHTLSPGEQPSWSPTEGVQPDDPTGKTALWSTPTAPNTISCLTGAIPAGF